MTLRNKSIYYGVLVAVGTVLAGLSIGLPFFGENRISDLFSGMGFALVAVGVIRLVQIKRLRRDPERAREVEAMQQEERTRFLSGRAMAWVFYVSIFAELAIGIVGIAVGQSLLGRAFNYLACGQCLLYGIVYRVLNRKY